MATSIASPPPLPLSSRQKTNYTRLCRLLIDTGTKVLRGILDSLHPSADLEKYLNSPAVNNKLKTLRTQRILNSKQWDKLYPASGVPCSTSFDITLLFLLLRNTCGLTPPTAGWDAAPLPADLSKEADLIRLKGFRNEIGHRTVAELSDADYETYWTKIEAALIRLGGLHYERDIQRLKIESIDPENEAHLRVILQSWEEGDDKKIDAFIKKLNESRSAGLITFCNLPQKPSHVTVDRTNEVSKIMAEIQRLQFTYPDEITQTYLSGNPGCGKSELARQIGKKYFEETQESMKCVTTLNASNLESLTQSYMELACQLQCNEISITSIMNANNSQEQKLIQLKGLVQPKLQTYSSWLVIVDNVEDIHLVSKYIPQPGQNLYSGKGHILITTQDSQSIPLCDPHSYQTTMSHGMEPVDAERCLCDISGCSDEGQIVYSVAKELDFQPLALACAAVYVQRVRLVDPTMTWDIYLQIIRKGNRELTERFYANTNNMAYGKSMTTAVSMAVEKLKESNVMFHAFEFLAALAPEFISLEHVVNYVMKCMPGEDEISVKLQIINSSLVLTSTDKDELYVRVHQIVFSVIQSIMGRMHGNEENELLYLTKVAEVFSCVQENHDDSTEYIASTGKLVSHFINLSSIIKMFFERNGILVLTEKNKYGVRYCMNRKTCTTRQHLPLVELMCVVLSRVLLMHGKYEASRILLELCITITIQICSEEKDSSSSFSGARDVKLALMFNQLGTVLGRIGEYHKAKVCFEEALDINKRMYGSNHAIIAVSLNGLGVVLRNLSRYKEARQCYKEALDIQKGTYGSNDICVANTLNNLGLVLRDLGRYKEAKECYETCLNINVSTRKRGHPDVAVALGNLGTVLTGLGKYEESKKRCEEALSIHNAVYEESHPIIGFDLYFLGLSLHGLGDYLNSRHFFERSLAILEAAYGKHHPQVAKTLNALGQLQLEQGDNEQAKLNLDRALAINETHFSENHPQVAVTLNNLGRLCVNINEHVEAKRYFERALTINEETFDENHPKIAITLYNLGNLLLKMKEEKEGNHCLERALAIKEKNPDYAFKF